MRRRIRNGESIAAIFDDYKLFPAEFYDVLHSAEEAGRTPEAMKHLAEELGERAEHQLALLNTALGWAVWCFVAAFVIFFIFRIMLSYVRVLNEFLWVSPGPRLAA
jgi:type II secretory pathway component PulF